MQRPNTDWDKGDKRYSPHLKALERYETHILAKAAALPDGYEFEVPCNLVCEDGTEVRGFADAVHRESGTVLELKFARRLQRSHAIQAVGYAVMLDPPMQGLPWKVRVVGLRTGCTMCVDSPALLDPEPTRAFLKDRIEPSQAKSSSFGRAGSKKHCKNDVSSDQHAQDTTATPQQRKCSICQKTGHNKSNFRWSSEPTRRAPYFPGWAARLWAHGHECLADLYQSAKGRESLAGR